MYNRMPVKANYFSLDFLTGVVRAFKDNGLQLD